MNVLTSSDLYGFRKNRVLFSTIVTGLFSCVGFGLSSVVIQMPTGASTAPFEVAGWFWMISAYCLYSILIERALALRNRLAIPKIYLQAVKYMGPLILVIPQILYLAFLSDTMRYYQALNICTTVGTLLYIVANLILSVSFVYTLAFHRQQSILNFIRNRPSESGNLVFNTFINSFFVVCRIVGIILPLTAQPTLFLSFQNTAGNFVAITVFKDYIFVTRQVSKEILSTRLSPQSGGNHTSKNHSNATASKVGALN
ncbi:hypothetical protein BKA69DRAFT_916503 [Paraphysoderma sedebokerense]|nr:hypothetical protein BKA69DRAFT_916503 [Paraphysoderma sedebokerense]